MLIELRITDFAIIDELSLELAPGLVAFTGETGAGKSIIVDAISLLLGGRADADMIRTGCQAARVEGTLRLDGQVRDAVVAILEREALLEDASDTLALGREVRREGRHVCRVNGRTVSLGLLKEIGQSLVDVHGQSEHLSLLRVREHVGLLDRAAGTDGLRAEFAELAAQLRRTQDQLERLRAGERDAARRLDMLNFQVNEIEAAKLRAGEDVALLEERTRLANAEHLAALADEALAALVEGVDGQPSASDQLGQAAQALAGLAKIDATQGDPRDQVQALAEQVADLARDLTTYRESIEFNPKRLDAVEERLELVRTLKRKYGDTIEAVLDHAVRARQERETISGAGERIAELERAEADLKRQVGSLGQRLSIARRQAAEALARGVEAELADLRMDAARFGVSVVWQPDAAGVPVEGQAGPNAATDHVIFQPPVPSPQPPTVAFDSTGLDHIEFLVAPNPGEGLKPLAKVASGGETSRLMLALKGVLARADRTPTLIFDEIDQGIGGRVGAVVGSKLSSLTASHQVLCVTHLPQLAAYADQHFKVEKRPAGDRTVTRVIALDGAARVGELAQMLGSLGEKTRQSAEEILQAVQREKAGHSVTA